MHLLSWLSLTVSFNEISAGRFREIKSRDHAVSDETLSSPRAAAEASASFLESRAHVSASHSPFMTVSECTHQIDIVGARKALLWSASFDQASKAIRTADEPGASFPQLSGYAMLNTLLGRDTLMAYKKSFQHERQAVRVAAETAFWASCSQALASLTEGTVYYMAPNPLNVLKDDTLDWTLAGVRPGSFVELHEYPRLCSNSRVTQFVHISGIDPEFVEDLTRKLREDRRTGCPDAQPIPTGPSQDQELLLSQENDHGGASRPAPRTRRDKDLSISTTTAAGDQSADADRPLTTGKVRGSL